MARLPARSRGRALRRDLAWRAHGLVHASHAAGPGLEDDCDPGIGWRRGGGPRATVGVPDRSADSNRLVDGGPRARRRGPLAGGARDAPGCGLRRETRPLSESATDQRAGWRGQGVAVSREQTENTTP